VPTCASPAVAFRGLPAAPLHIHTPTLHPQHALLVRALFSGTTTHRPGGKCVNSVNGRDRHRLAAFCGRANGFGCFAIPSRRRRNWLRELPAAQRCCGGQRGRTTAAGLPGGASSVGVRCRCLALLTISRLWAQKNSPPTLLLPRGLLLLPCAPLSPSLCVSCSSDVTWWRHRLLRRRMKVRWWRKTGISHFANKVACAPRFKCLPGDKTDVGVKAVRGGNERRLFHGATCPHAARRRLRVRRVLRRALSASSADSRRALYALAAYSAPPYACASRVVTSTSMGCLPLHYTAQSASPGSRLG